MWRIFDGLFGALTIFDWITPTIQLVMNVSEDVSRVIKREPLDSYVDIYAADFPKACNILDGYNISHGILDVIIPPLYPLVYWKGIKVPHEKEVEVLTAFDLAGVRYKA